MRIAIGGVLHETSTFANTPTTLADFESGFGLYRGPEIPSLRGRTVVHARFRIETYVIPDQPRPQGESDQSAVTSPPNPGGDR